MQLPGGVERGQACVREGLADRHAVDAERPWLVAAEVREHQHADRRSAVGHDTTRRPDPGLPAERDHAGAGTDAPFGDGRVRRRERPACVRRLHLHDACIVEPAVVAFSDDRQDDVLDPDRAVRGDRGRDRPVEHAPDLHRRRQVDGRLEHAPFADRERAGQLAGAVQHRDAGGQRLPEERGWIGRHDRGDTRPCHAAAGRRVGLVPPDRHVPDGHAAERR